MLYNIIYYNSYYFIRLLNYIYQSDLIKLRFSGKTALHIKRSSLHSTVRVRWLCVFKVARRIARAFLATPNEKNSNMIPCFSSYLMIFSYNRYGIRTLRSLFAGY